ncbi:MAG: exosome complex RNA-binding protein Csl4 [Methanobacteriota archaeon]
MGRSGDGRKVVMPGEEIAASEEFVVGEGTYEREGRIFASVTGTVELDKLDMVARVRALNAPRQLKAGDTIVGAVSEIRGTMVNIQTIAPEEDGRRMTGQDMGTIHISKVTEGRSDDLREMFRLGDVVRAKVIQVKPSLQLTTAGPDFGVIKAFCTKCRAPLALRKGDLRCDNCERIERRKLAKGYSSPAFFEEG